MTAVSFWDDSHVWGRYREVVTSDDTIVRYLEYHEGGRTSVHRHDAVTETIMVLGGQVRFFWGTDPDRLQEEVHGPGSVVVFPPGIWHAAECVEPVDETSSCARAVEHCQGEIAGGSYQILRAASARSAQVAAGLAEKKG